MVLVAKKRFTKVQITVRVHPQNLERLDQVGERLFRNRSEMVDRAIEEFLERHDPSPSGLHREDRPKRGQGK
jgi:metal-responsive CopG/Arc/MetJ family transcriptional regulator